MFAAVPCYQLKGLNRLIRKDLPASHGLIQTWRELIRLKKK
jgi:fatty acid desaturase